jgi:hypothetical protein
MEGVEGMIPKRRILIRALAPACLTAVGAAHAQEPYPNSPPPSPLPVSPSVVAAANPPAGCVPGHCTHRTFIGRYRCKRHLQEAFLGFPEEFDRPPLGAMMHTLNATAIRNGEAAVMVFYQYDFEPGTTTLNMRGRDKLAEIARLLPANFYPVVIERSRDYALDDVRRKAIFGALASGPFPIPNERVVVGPAIARGMLGEEALIIHQSTVTRVSQTGPPIGSGSDSSSSASSK